MLILIKINIDISTDKSLPDFVHCICVEYNEESAGKCREKEKYCSQLVQLTIHLIRKLVPEAKLGINIKTVHKGNRNAHYRGYGIVDNRAYLRVPQVPHQFFLIFTVRDS